MNKTPACDREISPVRIHPDPPPINETSDTPWWGKCGLRVAWPRIA
jgi:hypothetical protein